MKEWLHKGRKNMENPKGSVIFYGRRCRLLIYKKRNLPFGDAKKYDISFFDTDAGGGPYERSTILPSESRDILSGK